MEKFIQNCIRVLKNIFWYLTLFSFPQVSCLWRLGSVIMNWCIKQRHRILPWQRHATRQHVWLQAKYMEDDIWLPPHSSPHAGQGVQLLLEFSFSAINSTSSHGWVDEDDEANPNDKPSSLQIPIDSRILFSILPKFGPFGNTWCKAPENQSKSWGSKIPWENSSRGCSRMVEGDHHQNPCIWKWKMKWFCP